jgi:ATP-dependent DNA ligase
MLCAFDLIALDGKDIRRAPLEERKHALANLLFKEHDGIAFNRHYDCDGAIVRALCQSAWDHLSQGQGQQLG